MSSRSVAEQKFEIVLLFRRYSDDYDDDEMVYYDSVEYRYSMSLHKVQTWRGRRRRSESNNVEENFNCQVHKYLSEEKKKCESFDSFCSV